jgi:hypothetical protein
MAAIVSDIVTAIKASCATTLGASYQELPFVYSVTENNERTARLAYGVRPLGGESASGVNRVYTMDHRFEILLADTVARCQNDTQKSSAILTLFNKADEIFKVLVNTKISLPSTVLNVTGPSFGEPELYADNKFVVLRMQVSVLYRSSLA